MAPARIGRIAFVAYVAAALVLAFASVALGKMIVEDTPYAPYTSPSDMRTSLVPYYSVLHGSEPYAPYTTTSDMQRTSLLPYYSVINGTSAYAPYTDIDLEHTLLPRFRILR